MRQVSASDLPVSSDKAETPQTIVAVRSADRERGQRGSGRRTHGEDGLKGAPPSNRAPPNSIEEENNIEEISFKPLLLGIDSLYLSFPGDLTEAWEIELGRLKLLAQSDSEKEQSLAQLKIHEHLFEVSDHGAKRFPFILRDNCYLIKLTNSRAKSLPLAHVQIASEYLSAVGVEAATADLCSVIAQFSENSAPPKISRADLFLDFVCAVDFDGLDQSCWLTRANMLAKYYDRRIPCPFTGWVVGVGGDLSSRLYEKTVEIEYKSRKVYLYELWQPQGWQQGDKVWRQEFQLRREVLKQLRIEYVPDLLTQQAQLWRYLTQDWLRLSIPNPNDATRTRWATHPAWQAVSEVYAQPFDQPRLKRFRAQRLPRDDWMFLNGLGGVTSFMASRGISDIGEGLGEFLLHANDYHFIRTRELGAMDRYVKRKVALKGRRFNTINNRMKYPGSIHEQQEQAEIPQHTKDGDDGNA